MVLNSLSTKNVLGLSLPEMAKIARVKLKLLSVSNGTNFGDSQNCRITLDIYCNQIHSMRGSNDVLLCNLGTNRLSQRDFACIYKLWIIMFCVPQLGLKWTLMKPDLLVYFHCLAHYQKPTENKFQCCLYFEFCFPELKIFGSMESSRYFQIQSKIMATTLYLLAVYFNNIRLTQGKAICFLIVHLETIIKKAKNIVIALIFG